MLEVLSNLLFEFFDFCPSQVIPAPRMQALSTGAQVACHGGACLSLVIAVKLLRMETLTFFNKMFLAYFLTDFVMGNIETYFHFKLWNDRCGV